MQSLELKAFWQFMNIWVLMRPIISFTYCRQKHQKQAMSVISVWRLQVQVQTGTVWIFRLQLWKSFFNRMIKGERRRVKVERGEEQNRQKGRGGNDQKRETIPGPSRAGSHISQHRCPCVSFNIGAILPCSKVFPHFLPLIILMLMLVFKIHMC